MPRSTSSSPALQNQPEISKRGSSKVRENRRQRRSPFGARSRERLDRDRAEFRVDRARQHRPAGQPQLRNARRHILGLMAGLRTGAVEFDHRGRARRRQVAEGEDVLAPAAARVPPAGVARCLVEVRDRHGKGRERPVDLDPAGPGRRFGRDAAAGQADELRGDQPHRAERAAIERRPAAPRRGPRRRTGAAADGSQPKRAGAIARRPGRANGQPTAEQQRGQQCHEVGRARTA